MLAVALCYTNVVLNAVTTLWRQLFQRFFESAFELEPAPADRARMFHAITPPTLLEVNGLNHLYGASNIQIAFGVFHAEHLHRGVLLRCNAPLSNRKECSVKQD